MTPFIMNTNCTESGSSCRNFAFFEITGCYWITSSLWAHRRIITVLSKSNSASFKFIFQCHCSSFILQNCLIYIYIIVLLRNKLKITQHRQKRSKLDQRCSVYTVRLIHRSREKTVRQTMQSPIELFFAPINPSAPHMPRRGGHHQELSISKPVTKLSEVWMQGGSLTVWLLGFRAASLNRAYLAGWEM